MVYVPQTNLSDMIVYATHGHALQGFLQHLLRILALRRTLITREVLQQQVQIT